jgi:hypothetical protein
MREGGGRETRKRTPAGERGRQGGAGLRNADVRELCGVEHVEVEVQVERRRPRPAAAGLGRVAAYSEIEAPIISVCLV